MQTHPEVTGALLIDESLLGPVCLSHACNSLQSNKHYYHHNCCGGSFQMVAAEGLAQRLGDWPNQRTAEQGRRNFDESAVGHEYLICMPMVTWRKCLRLKSCTCASSSGLTCASHADTLSPSKRKKERKHNPAISSIWGMPLGCPCCSADHCSLPRASLASPHNFSPLKF